MEGRKGRDPPSPELCRCRNGLLCIQWVPLPCLTGCCELWVRLCGQLSKGPGLGGGCQVWELVTILTSSPFPQDRGQDAQCVQSQSWAEAILKKTKVLWAELRPPKGMR